MDEGNEGTSGVLFPEQTVRRGGLRADSSPICKSVSGLRLRPRLFRRVLKPENPGKILNVHIAKL
jgi:hypothetical protein